MANPYFQDLLADADQDIIGQLNEDFIYDNGVGIKYIVREDVLHDNVMNEIVVSNFKDAYDIDIYMPVESGELLAPTTFMDFGGYGFGKDFLTIYFDKEKFFAKVDQLPQESDLIYIEQIDRIYEINNVKSDDAFVSGGQVFSIMATMSVFKPGEGTQHFDSSLDVASNAIDKILGQTNPSVILGEFIDFSSDSPYFDHTPDLFYHPEDPPLSAFTFDKTLTTSAVYTVTFDDDIDNAFDSTSEFDFSIDGGDPSILEEILNNELDLQEIVNSSSDNEELICTEPGTPINNDDKNPYGFF